MTSVYVTGSVIQKRAIRKVAKFIETNGNFSVDYAYRRQSLKYKLEQIIDHFDNIESADIIVAINTDHTIIGHGVLYEMEYVKRCGKKLVVTNGDDLGDLFITLCLSGNHE